MDIANCPPFDSSQCVRARLSVCYLYKGNKTGGTKVYMRGKNEGGGKVMDWLMDLKCAELWLRVERAVSCSNAFIATQMKKAAQPADRSRSYVFMY